MPMVSKFCEATHISTMEGLRSIKLKKFSLEKMTKFIVLKMRQFKQKSPRYKIFKEKWQLEK